MSEQHMVFYHGNQQVSVDFSAEAISSDASLILLEKLKKNHQLIEQFSQSIDDPRQQGKVEHPTERIHPTNYIFYPGCKQGSLPIKKL